MLTVAGLSKAFGGRQLFDDVSLTLLSGERVGLVGPNGAGKSTLLKIILGQEMPDAGEVTFIRGTRFGYLPQESEPAGNEIVLDVAVPHDHEHDGQFVAKTYFKCELRGITNGPGTDHRANWPACGKFCSLRAGLAPF